MYIMDWSRLTTAEFIKLYQSKPFLWKINSIKYRNKNLKTVAYHELMSFLKTKGLGSFSNHLFQFHTTFVITANGQSTAYWWASFDPLTPSFTFFWDIMVTDHHLCFSKVYYFFSTIFKMFEFENNVIDLTQMHYITIITYNSAEKNWSCKTGGLLPEHKTGKQISTSNRQWKSAGWYAPRKVTDFHFDVSGHNLRPKD